MIDVDMDCRLERLCDEQGFDLSEIDEEFPLWIKVRCSQCEALTINNVPCHETGCPNG